ncbi:cytochrome P450 [Marinactinospora endophytica]
MEPLIKLDTPDLDTPTVRERLRAAGPVARLLLPGGVSVRAVTHYAELRAVLADPGTFARGWRNWRALVEGEVDRAHPIVGLIAGVDSMLASNGADHRRARSVLQAAFTRGRVEGLRPRVQEIVTELLEQIAAAGDRVDIKAGFAWPLPVRVLCDLLGLDEHQAPLMSDIATRVFSGDPTVDQDARALLAKIVAAKRTEPGDDLTSALITACDERKISETELIDNLYLLVIAGAETTMGTLTNGIRALLNHPDQLGLLRTGRASWRTAIEEILRWDTSVALLPAVFPTRDVEIGGTWIPAGEPILLAYSAANRDPAAWEDPDRFDITRAGRSHIAFGYGVHMCLGAPLARLELGEALPALFHRFPGLRLDAAEQDLRPAPTSPIMNHPLTLPVRLGGS